MVAMIGTGSGSASAFICTSKTYGTGLDRGFAAPDQLLVARDTLEVVDLFELRWEGDIVFLHKVYSNRIGLEADNELVPEVTVEFRSEIALDSDRSKGSRELGNRLGVLLPDAREFSSAGQHRHLAVVGPELLERFESDRVVGERCRHVWIAHGCLHTDTRKQKRLFLGCDGYAVRLNEEGELRLVELQLYCILV